LNRLNAAFFIIYAIIPELEFSCQCHKNGY